MNLAWLEMLLPRPRYPRAAWPYPVGPALVPLACAHCHAECGVTRWERWNGFLSACPRCGFLIGRRWQIKAVLYAGVFLNALSFFFTMRPRTALAAFAAWLALWFGRSYLLRPPIGAPSLETAYFSIALIGPVLINAAILVRHEVDLDAHRPYAAPVRDAGARSPW